MISFFRLRKIKVMQQKIDQLGMRLVEIEQLPMGDKSMKVNIANRIKELLNEAIAEYEKYISK